MKRINNQEGREHVLSSKKAEELLHDNLVNLDHEEAWVLHLTSSGKVIAKEMISKGCLDKTALDCRTVLRQALLHNAGSIILLHNHPSGSPVPSGADIAFTDKLRKACQMMDIHLLDHIVVAEEGYFSFCDERTYKFIQ